VTGFVTRNQVQYAISNINSNTNLTTNSNDVMVVAVTAERKRRLIRPVDEGHRSQLTAAKYRRDIEHFLNYIQDLDALLDLRHKANQELVIKYNRSLRDNEEKIHKGSDYIRRISSLLSTNETEPFNV
jgi:hypothetical protein